MDGATPQGPSRRTIVKGAAWSVPVIAMSMNVPMAAATYPPCTEEGRYEKSTAGAFTVVIPECASVVEFVLRGGGGGTIAGRSDLSNGAVITGSMQLTPGTSRVLSGIVGQGGQISQGATASGGTGFGRGGDGSPTTRSGIYSYGGGGGSVLKLDGATLAVAGGGGGFASGQGSNLVRLDTVTEQVPDVRIGNKYGFGSAGNGSGSSGNGAGVMVRARDNLSAYLVIESGRTNGLFSSTGGQAGGYGPQASGNWRFDGVSHPPQYLRGVWGGDAGSGSNGGGDGGNGADVSRWGSSHNYGAAGGGGGGYAGGGGGGLYLAAHGNAPTTPLVAAGGGGAGSNFIQQPDWTVRTSGLARQSATRGHLGLVSITWR